MSKQSGRHTDWIAGWRCRNTSELSWRLVWRTRVVGSHFLLHTDCHFEPFVLILIFGQWGREWRMNVEGHYEQAQGGSTVRMLLSDDDHGILSCLRRIHCKCQAKRRGLHCSARGIHTVFRNWQADYLIILIHGKAWEVMRQGRSYIPR